MKTEPSKVYEYIMEYLIPIQRVKNGLLSLADCLNKKYRIPESVLYGVAKEQIEETEVTSDRYFLFALVDSMQEMEIIPKENLSEFFTENEIAEGKKWKYKKRKTFKSFSIPMIQIEENQWVGVVDVDWFMTLRRSGMIRYNPETQRPMKKITRNKVDYYTITKNKNAIHDIRQMYRNKSYIPNDIVLNMGEDSEADFYYNDEEKLLVIKSIKFFDIIDGYNRYTAMCQEKDYNPDFQQNFVLQIVNFETERAIQYIYQQDLKIKMRRVDSASMNIYDKANEICRKMNTFEGIWKGEINQTGGIVNIGELSTIIRTLWGRDGGINGKEFKIIRLINTSLEQMDYAGLPVRKRLSNVQLLTLMYYIRYYVQDNNTSIDIDKISTALSKANSLNGESLIRRNKYINSKTVEEVKELFK